MKPSKARVILRDSPDQAGPRPESRTSEEEVDDSAIISATKLAKEIEKDDWTHVEWSEGTKGALSADVARRWVTIVKHTNTGPEFQEDGWLLLERRGSELKAWICWGVEELSLDELVTSAHMRWPIEQFHREAKQVLGLNRFEGRTWQGWHHHVTVVLLAHAYLATQRAANGAAAESLPTFPEVARISIVEMATRTAQRQGLDRQKAEDVAEAFIRGYTDW
jgi:SRSO17 transposase